ncbi:MAG: hypothetical protein SVT52_04275 [Planctomycetota bacterium]|nr:hypothetical protein [Planctomycetota bacterium]
MPEELDLPESKEPVSPEPQSAGDEEEPVVLKPGPAKPDDEPISLVESDGSGQKIGMVRELGDAKAKAKVEQRQYKRPLNLTGQGATRCRIFHSRIAAAPLTYMEQQINDWLDGEKIEIKNVGHVIGIMEGKTPQPNVVVMVWY